MATRMVLVHSLDQARGKTMCEVEIERLNSQTISASNSGWKITCEKCLDALVTPPILYHVTLKKNVPAIKRQGIRNRLTTNKRAVWSNQLGGKQGDPSYVYVINKFTDAVRLAIRLEYHTKQKVAIVTIKNSWVKLEPDVHVDNWLNTWFKTKDEIEPRYIGEVNDLTLDHKRAAVIRV